MKKQIKRKERKSKGRQKNKEITEEKNNEGVNNVEKNNEVLKQKNEVREK